MKVCGQCGFEKSVDDFAFKNTSTGRRQSKCKECFNLRNHKYYTDNKPYYISKAEQQKKTLKEWVRNLKESTPCLDCGNKYPYFVMDFDHREGVDKIALVSRLAAEGSAKKAKEEILKCDIVCSNCHRQRTHDRLSVAQMD